MQLFYGFRKFSEQGDSLFLVSKGLPSWQQDDLLDGVKGKIPAWFFGGLASHWLPLQPLWEELSSTFPACKHPRVRSGPSPSLGKRAQQPLAPWCLPMSFPEVPVRLPFHSHRAPDLPCPILLTAPPVLIAPVAGRRPPCLPCRAARADARPSWRTWLPSQVSLPGEYTLIYIPPELVSSSLALNPSWKSWTDSFSPWRSSS